MIGTRLYTNEDVEKSMEKLKLKSQMEIVEDILLECHVYHHDTPDGIATYIKKSDVKNILTTLKLKQEGL